MFERYTDQARRAFLHAIRMQPGRVTIDGNRAPALLGLIRESRGLTAQALAR